MGQNFFESDLLGIDSPLSLKDKSNWQFSDRFVSFFGQLAFKIESLAFVVICFFLLFALFAILTGPDNPRALIFVTVCITCASFLCFGIYFTLNVGQFTGSSSPPTRTSKLFVSSFRNSFERFQRDRYSKLDIIGAALMYVGFVTLPISTLLLISSIILTIRLCIDERKRKVPDVNRNLIIQNF